MDARLLLEITHPPIAAEATIHVATRHKNPPVRQLLGIGAVEREGTRLWI